MYEPFTFSNARLVHWLSLVTDVDRMRERQEELGRCRDLTCARQGMDGKLSEVAEDMLLMHCEFLISRSQLFPLLVTWITTEIVQRAREIWSLCC